MSTPVRWMAPPLDFVAAVEAEAEPAPILRPPTLEEIQAIEDAAYNEGLE
ncbi:MAG TPA: flagellar assembly protein FliH, partial [Pseudoxanthomonas sp.]|nr:flagellar assembly protein FliH [Pseudoxanthomonas sp.]